jgi:acyl-coenzyme A synthetase/AMP-(fatty) acid ligase
MSHRIELGEIEAALNAIDFIDVACCFYDHDRHKIVCVYQSGEDRRRQIASALIERLPKYMRPNKYIRMDQMPLNAHVKIDRRLLRTMYEEGKLK